MPNFDYVARDGAGNVRTGTVQAETEEHLRDVLRTSNLYLTKYITSEDASQRGQKRFVIFGGKVKLGDMVVMSRQLATLVRAGLPIVEALGTLATQTENMTLADTLRQVRLEVLAGASLAEAMRAHPKVFNDLYVALVDAGEAAGVLDQTLEIAATQFDKEAVLRETVKSAMTYPKIVVAASFGVVAFMLVFIVPTFAKVYESFSAKLPSMTLLLMAVSDLVLHWWWAVVLVILAVWFGFRHYRSTPRGRHVTDQMLLRIPMLGKVLRKIAIARFAQTWAGSTKGGIPILKALTISANTAGNVIVRDAVLRVAKHVQEGSPTAAALDETREFPPMVTRMIAAGERSGKLDEMLDEVTKFYNRDVDYAVTKMTRMLEPAMTVIVGGIVLFVLLGLYMPIFTLTQVIKK